MRLNLRQLRAKIDALRKWSIKARGEIYGSGIGDQQPVDPGGNHQLRRPQKSIVLGNDTFLLNDIAETVVGLRVQGDIELPRKTRTKRRGRLLRRIDDREASRSVDRRRGNNLGCRVSLGRYDVQDNLVGAAAELPDCRLSKEASCNYDPGEHWTFATHRLKLPLLGATRAAEL